MSRKKVKKGRGREKVEHHFDSRVGAILRTMSKALFGLRIKSM